MSDWGIHFDFVSFFFFGEPKHPLLEDKEFKDGYLEQQNYDTVEPK